MDLRALFPPERDEDLALLLPPVPLLEVRLQGVRRPVFRPGLLKDLAVRLDLAEDGYATRAGRGLEKGTTEAPQPTQWRSRTFFRPLAATVNLLPQKLHRDVLILVEDQLAQALKQALEELRAQRVRLATIRRRHISEEYARLHRTSGSTHKTQRNSGLTHQAHDAASKVAMWVMHPPPL